MSTNSLRTIQCAQCKKSLYQTDGRAIRAMNPGECTPRTILLTINNEHITYCSRVCAARWILQQPDSRFGTGRSLHW